MGWYLLGDDGCLQVINFKYPFPHTKHLDLCLSWLVEAGGAGVQTPVKEIINWSLTSETFPKVLKDAVVRPL